MIWPPRGRLILVVCAVAIFQTVTAITALHVAVHRDDHAGRAAVGRDMVRRLLAAGANPTLRDGNGRTATEWSVLKRTTRPRAERDDFLWTRIRPIDLFAPLRRGALVYVPPAYGLGAMRTIYGIVDALDAHFWMLGFAHGPYKQREFEQEVRESRTPSTIELVSPGHPAERRREFARTLEHLANDPRPKVAMVVPAPGHEHDTTIALPGLAADPTVLATIVVAPFTPERGDVPGGTPEGFDAQITFDRIRAGLRIWPAIDPANTNCLGYPNPRHEELAAGARETLTAYASIDPGLDLPDPTTFDDTALAERAQRLHRYFAHAFRPFEHLAAEPAAHTPIDQLLRTVEEVLDR